MNRLLPSPQPGCPYSSVPLDKIPATSQVRLKHPFPRKALPGSSRQSHALPALGSTVPMPDLLSLISLSSHPHGAWHR